MGVSSGPCQNQVVAMDHFVPATIAQNGLDFDRAFTGDPLRVGRIVSRQTTSDFPALTVFYQNGVAPLEAPVNLANAGGEQAPAVLEGAHRAVVNHQYTFGAQHTPD